MRDCYLVSKEDWGKSNIQTTLVALVAERGLEMFQPNQFNKLLKKWGVCNEMCM